jgi:hypothetical protein
MLDAVEGFCVILLIRFWGDGDFGGIWVFLRGIG